MEEKPTTRHFVCAVAVQYKSGREYDLRVAGLELTMLVSRSAVVALYKSGRESDPRVAGPKLTMLVSGSAVVALYNSGRE